MRKIIFVGLSAIFSIIFLTTYPNKDNIQASDEIIESPEAIELSKTVESETIELESGQPPTTQVVGFTEVATTTTFIIDIREYWFRF